MVDTHFSDFFDVNPSMLDRVGAFNISLISDLPLFIDPFLLFNSREPKYRALHDAIIRYVRFLRDRAVEGQIGEGELKAWFVFSEVKQTWLGYSVLGNRGSGLGRDFASALNRNLNTIFTDFGNEKIARGSHLEKLCLVRDGVGRDNISDFTTNLIKGFLLEYTQTFARQHIAPALRRRKVVERVQFNYETETWEQREFELPWLRDDYVLLTPRDILTKDETWISRADMIESFHRIADSIPNDQLRAQVNRYFAKQLSQKPSADEVRRAAVRTLETFPAVLEYYIRYKEDHGEEARATSREKVAESETLFVHQAQALIAALQSSTTFYGQPGRTYQEARARLLFLKDVIENKGGHKVFYVKGKPVRREADAQILFRLTWFGTPSDIGREVNDGRGPVDFKASRGARDKTLVEFKLASNSQLKRNLAYQAEVYQKASDAGQSLKAIVYFTSEEFDKVDRILGELKLRGHRSIVVIDARADNKPSGSKARQGR
jgi:hypothetical protein